MYKSMVCHFCTKACTGFGYSRVVTIFWW